MSAPARAAGGQTPLRVVVVDDHRLFRTGVRAELEAAAGGTVEVVAEAADVPEAIAAVRAHLPDVVLLDVHLPGGGGVGVLRAVLADPACEVRFLALSVSDAAEDVIGVIRAGARGYVTKTIGGAELADAIGRVAAGDAVFSPRLAGFVLDAFAQADAPGPAPAMDPELDLLSAREREVLRLIARGYTYKEVAKHLFIAVKTGETHVSAVRRRLQRSTRHALSRWAADRRLV
ncbi:MAG: response regulator [Sporichthyaceae bacterium]